jgi:outer membrane protein TolC
VTLPWQAAAQQPDPSREVRRLTVDDAVRQALQHNLGVQVARIDPQIQDVSIAQYLAAWTPSFTSAVATSRTETPSASFLSGAQGTSTTDERLSSNVGLRQNLKWKGASYSIGWDNSRSTTNNIFSSFSPQVNSSLSLSISQPLLRNFSIDNLRQQLDVGRKNRDISDLRLQSSILTTQRTVRHAYWELAYAYEALTVQQQSLHLARESLRNNRARVEIGTMAPIDIVEAEAEVAQREEAVIVAEAAIDRAEDTLRALIYDSAAPDFWTFRIEPTDRPPFTPVPVNVDGAVRNALDKRTDLRESKKSIEANDISIRYFRNQTLPDVTAQLDYGLSGLGGVQSVRGEGFPGPIIGTTQRSYGSVLGDVFGNDFPKWTLTFNVSYPLGSSQEETSLARARLQHSQSQTQLKNQQLQVATQVRDAARSLTTNQKRVASTAASRELARRRLEAEQKKFAAGQSTSFFVFQAQRDLAQARNNELRAILDYNKSIVDFDTVQETPLR